MCFEFLLYLNLTYDSNREDIHAELCYYIILLTQLNFLFMQLILFHSYDLFIIHFLQEFTTYFI